MMRLFLSLLAGLLALCHVNGFTGHTPVFQPSSTKSYTHSTKGNGMTMRARVCDLLGKKPNRQARVVTFSHTRNKKVQEVNLQWKRFFSEDLKRTVRLRLSTKGIKTVDKMGGSIDAAAKKFSVDLAKF